MTDLIEINRAYQAANNLIQQEDDRMDRAIRKLSGTN
jgi:flagellar basal body rod protein FlgG